MNIIFLSVSPSVLLYNLQLEGGGDVVTYAEIKCYNCENRFTLHTEQCEDVEQLKCPFCCARMNERFTSFTIDMLFRASELNKELRSKSEDGINPEFQVDFKHVFVPLDKYPSDD